MVKLDMRVVDEKIDSLVEGTEKGTFVPQGHDDILTKAIGTFEHGGRVRGVEEKLELEFTSVDISADVSFPT
ncbi:hypothetical protein MTR_5g020725 [Medicago truncatula]|uniref:Uncharacterized protein n=1 Tax=Medicago truncatula TaxID=3880 RepID=A0A072UD63_MEDTR|nr:hypothetical protein MTR_5g020725 [Medicago truncatula]